MLSLDAPAVVRGLFQPGDAMTVAELRAVLDALCARDGGSADLECVVETGDGPGVLVRSVYLARAVELDDAGERRVAGVAVRLDTTG